jgi:glucose/arabinose dehydrogenase
MMRLFLSAILLLLLVQFSSSSIQAQGQVQPFVLNPKFQVQRVFAGHFEPSSMAFLGPDDILVLDRDEGKVFRVTHGIQSDPLLDVNVATNGYRGLLGVADSVNQNNTYVFLYYTQSASQDSSDKFQHPVNPLGNRLYRYELVNNKLINPKLLLDLPVLPGPKDNGGVIKIGPDKNIYLIIGDLQGSFRNNQYETMTQNYQNSTKVDGRAGILRITQDGKPVGLGILGQSLPLNLYYAYGIRNSFGMDWDPTSGYLWDSENGPSFGDEINLVKPGFNSGWAIVQGFWKPLNQSIGPIDLHPDNLVNFGGHGNYNAPKFVWLNQVAPSAVKFINSTHYGSEFKADLLVGDANYGDIYYFKLDKSRQNLLLEGNLTDRIANNANELNNAIFAGGFGKVTDIEIGPDGLLYILSGQKELTSIYRISSGS